MTSGHIPKQLKPIPRATLRGIIQNFSKLITILLGTVFLTCIFFLTTRLNNLSAVIMISALLTGIAFGITTTRKKKWSAYLTPFFAFFEGIFTGTYGYFAELQHRFIIIQSISFIVGIMSLLFLIYLTRLVRFPERFKTFLKVVALCIVFFYFSSMLLYLFFDYNVVIITSKDWLGVSFSLGVVTVISLLIFLDYEWIDRITTMKVSKEIMMTTDLD